ncbi:unnamed protein product, partial [Mesorhabditis belari]|uniref:Uncharacterized protein n=1 Tax=Mesorhabditis belari TaxID=2138241 RepID=A0AAF3FJ41_9BILA
MIFDWVINCRTEEVEEYLSARLVRINGVYRQFDNYTIRTSTRNNTVNLSTRLVVDNMIYLTASWDSDTFVQGIAFSFRRADIEMATISEYDSIFFTMDVYQESIYYRIEAADVPIWVVFVLWDDGPLLLEKFRWDRYTGNGCEYKLFIGPPAAIKAHPERNFTIYRDVNAFIPQDFTNTRDFSILVPPGCAPSFALTSVEMLLTLHKFFSKEKFMAFR